MKRRWLQIHLSTGVLLMFAASGFAWANLRPFQIGPSDSNGAFVSGRGWPVHTYSGWIYTQGASLQVFAERIVELEAGVDRRDIWIALGLDTLIALVSLTLIALICERLTHRREVRKP
jgi:hypothetical protein